MKPRSHFFLTVAVVLISCGGEEPLSKVMETEHFRYYASSGDTIDTEWQEAYYGWLIPQLEVTVGEKLEYHKYRNRHHLRAVTGRDTNGFAEIGTYRFHTIWKIDNHESVHTVVTKTIGHPPALFNEGIAVAHQADYFEYPDFIPRWNGRDFDELSKGFKSSGAMPTLDALTESTRFFSFDTNMTYPIAGSFVRYLIDSRGLQPMKSFIAASSFTDDGPTVRRIFRAAYSITLDDAWSDWQNFLDSAP